METNAPGTGTELAMSELPTIGDLYLRIDSITTARDQLLRDKSELTWQLAKARAEVEQAARDRAELVGALRRILPCLDSYAAPGLIDIARAAIAKHGGAK